MLNEDGQDGLPVFLLVAFAASIGASIAVVATGGSGSPLVFGLGVLVMLAPASSALAAWKLSKRPFGNIGLKHFPVKYLVVALLLVPVATWIAGSVEFGIVGDGIPWAAWLEPDSSGMIHPEAPLGEEPFDQSELPAKIARRALLGLLVVSLLAFGEEVGWRGYMQPRLTARYGTSRGVMLGAAIWAAWHVPFGLSGIQSVEGLSNLSLVALAPLVHFGYGLMLGFLWERAQSIWIVTLAHGAGNNWANLPFRLMGSRNVILALLVRAVVYVVIGLGCLWLLRRPASPAPGTGGADGAKVAHTRNSNGPELGSPDGKLSRSSSVLLAGAVCLVLWALGMLPF